MKLKDIQIGGYSVADRLDTTIANLRFQDDKVMFDDYEKLDLILEVLRMIERYEENKELKLES
jgi:hypothetical protein